MFWKKNTSVSNMLFSGDNQKWSGRSYWIPGVKKTNNNTALPSIDVNWKRANLPVDRDNNIILPTDLQNDGIPFVLGIEKRDARNLETKKANFEIATNTLAWLENQITILDAKITALQEELTELNNVQAPNGGSLLLSFIDHEATIETATKLEVFLKETNEYAEIQKIKNTLEVEIASLEAEIKGTKESKGLAEKKKIAERKVESTKKDFEREQSEQGAQKLIAEITRGTEEYKQETTAYHSNKTSLESMRTDLETIKTFKEKDNSQWTNKNERRDATQILKKHTTLEWEITHNWNVEHLIKFLQDIIVSFEDAINTYDKRSAHLEDAYKILEKKEYRDLENQIERAQDESSAATETHNNTKTAKETALKKPRQEKISAAQNMEDTIKAASKKVENTNTSIDAEKSSHSTVLNDIRNIWEVIAQLNEASRSLENTLTKSELGNKLQDYINENIAALKDKEKIDKTRIGDIIAIARKKEISLNGQEERVRNRILGLRNNLIQDEENLGIVQTDETATLAAQAEIERVEQEEDVKIATAENIKHEKKAILTSLQDKLKVKKQEIETKYTTKIQKFLETEIVLPESITEDTKWLNFVPEKIASSVPVITASVANMTGDVLDWTEEIPEKKEEENTNMDDILASIKTGWGIVVELK